MSQYCIRIILVLATGFAVLVQPGALSSQELDRYQVIVECTDTINRYAHTRDQLDAEGHASLFTEDGVMEFGGSITGREAIAQRLRDNDGSAMTRHMSGSIVVSIDDNDGITARERRAQLPCLHRRGHVKVDEHCRDHESRTHGCIQTHCN